MEGVEVRDGILHAYDEFLLVRPETEVGGIIVVLNNETPRKGTVLDVGTCVPDPVNPGDLIYFHEGFKLEADIFSVHFSCILAYSKLIDSA